MLSQAIYWTKKTAQMNGREDGWFWKTQAEWEEETGLGRREQETARKYLEESGVIEQKRQGVPAKLWYRVNKEALDERLRTLPDKYGALRQSGMAQEATQDGRNTPIQNGSRSQTTNGAENTTETTAKPPKPPKGGMGVKDCKPTTEPALRVAALFNRRPTTAWAPKEIRAYKRLVPFDMEDLALVEAYHIFEKTHGGYNRRSLYAFLNNYQGELDKAREWKSSPKLNGHPQRNGHSPAIPHIPSAKELGLV